MTFSLIGTDTTTKQLVQINKTVRPQGLYIIGRQGTGKSGLIENLIVQDMKQGLGGCVLDPHGELLDHVIARLDAKREHDVILLDINDEDFPFGLNLFTCSNLNSPKEVEKTVDKVMHVFDKLLGVSDDTPLISQYLLHCTHTLVANPGYTMAEIPLLLSNKDCRQKLVATVKKSQTRLFWDEYYDPMPLADQRRERIFILRRVEKFLQDITLPIVGQTKSTIDFRAVMDESKILLVKLDSLQLSHITTLIGSLIIAAFLTAAPTRLKKQNIFNIYADEFQRFATEDFVTLLEEARKYGIGITIAHQNRAQLELSDKQADKNLKARTLSVGSLIVFCVPTDAHELAGQFDTTPIATETRKELVYAIHNDPVHWFHEGRGHRNKRVIEIIEKYLRPLFDKEKEVRGLLTDRLNNINDFLRQAMMYGELFPTSEKQRERLLHAMMEHFNLIDLWPYQKHLSSELELAKHPKHDEYGLLYDYPTFSKDTIPTFAAFFASYLGNGRFPGKAVEELYKERFYYRLKRWYEAKFPSIASQALHDKESRALKERAERQRVDDYHRTQMERIYGRHSSFDAFSIPSYIPFEEAGWGGDMALAYREGLKVIDTDPFWIEGKKEAMKLAQQDIELVKDFITEWDELGRLLQADPIQIASGYEEKPVPRTFADMLNDIANQLVDLPDYIARVRIKGDTEHLIQTIQPDKGVYGKMLQERITRIQAQNRKPNPYGYTRPRQEVEDEIIKRQSQCSQQAQQQQQPPQPQGRKMPACPKCGSPNPQGSIFCNQCGEKL